MRITQINTTDVEGGAAVIAWNLFNSYQIRGHDSYLIVGRKHSNNSNVYEIPRSNTSGFLTHTLENLNGRLLPLDARIRGFWRIRSLIRKMSYGRAMFERERGWEDFNFPGTRQLLNLTPERPDIIHLHNLHGGYFDPRVLPSISSKVPTLITLHDMWLLTGHCAHSLDCDRWRTGCGHCPDLEISPSIKRDATAFNLRRKKRIYNHSGLYVATPSQWLMNKVQKSILQDAVIEARVINNGVDTTTFSPADKITARKILNLPINARILVFVAAHHSRTHPFKDFATIEKALQQVKQDSSDGDPLIFIALGEEGTTEKSGNFEMHFLPYVRDREKLTHLFQSADIYIHAAKADTFPNSVLEALACGTPVVATGIGGIPEQIEDGRSGIITKPADSREMALAIKQLLGDKELMNSMGRFAVESVHKRFNLENQVDAYLDWYKQILEKNMNHALS